jgi:integrase/recombinase XerD
MLHLTVSTNACSVRGRRHPSPVTQLTLPMIDAPARPSVRRRRPAPPAAISLGELAEGFLNSRAWDPTREVYRQDLTAYMEWCRTEGVDPLASTREDLDRWREWMLHDQVDGRTAGSVTQRIGLAGSVVRRRLGVVSVFFEYLIDERGVGATNPASQVQRPLASDPDGPPARWLTSTQTNAILHAAERNGPIPHALACLLFIYGQLAVHVGELRGRDIFERDGAPHIQLTGRLGRRLTQPLVGRTQGAIAALGEIAADDPLVWLPGDPSPSAYRRRVTRCIAACARAAGVEDVTLIVVRHTWQANARLAGVPEDAIVEHSGIEWSVLAQWRRSVETQPAVSVERYLLDASR